MEIYVDQVWSAPLLPPFVIVWLIKTENIVIVEIQPSIRTISIY